MDPRTAFVAMTLMILLNGSVLSVMYRAMAADVRASAQDWRNGTLVLALAGVVMASQVALQAHVSAWLVLPLGNGLLCLGLCLYWRSVRRFCGRPDAWWVFSPVILTVMGLYVFTAFHPSLIWRVVIVSACSCVPMKASAWALRQHAAQDRLPVQQLLAIIFLAVAVFVTVRAIYIAGFEPDMTNLLDMKHWMSWVFPLVSGALPLIGTTAFLLSCAERSQAQLAVIAATDYLTGLANRRAIANHGEVAFSQAQRHQTGLAVAVIDIDHFKAVNDRFGHDSGDLALQHVARVLARDCRGPHRVGRQGGEEFVAILEGANLAQARIACERLRAGVEAAPLNLNGESVLLTVSIGASVLLPQDASFDAMLLRADKALFEAKAAGRNQLVVANE